MKKLFIISLFIIGLLIPSGFVFGAEGKKNRDNRDRNYKLNPGSNSHNFNFDYNIYRSRYNFYYPTYPTYPKYVVPRFYYSPGYNYCPPTNYYYNPYVYNPYVYPQVYPYYYPQRYYFYFGW